MEKVLIDTSAWILSFSQKGYSNLKLYTRELILSDSALITGMIRLELLQGAASDEKAKQFRKELDILKDVSAPNTIWEDVATLYRLLRRYGTTIAIPDLWIAQVAMKHNLIVLHCDKDFELIARHTRLKTLSIR